MVQGVTKTPLQFYLSSFQILTVNATQSSDIFRAAPVSMGLLGVITEVTFQCEPTFNLEETITTASFSDCIGNLRQLAYSAEHTRVWFEFWSRSCAYLQANRTKAKIRDRPNHLVAALKASQPYAFDLSVYIVPVPDIREIVLKLADLLT